MYKTLFIDYRKGGWDIQCGKTQQLENIINEWDSNGYELISITPCPYPVEASHCSFLLVFKSKE